MDRKAFRKTDKESIPTIDDLQKTFDDYKRRKDARSKNENELCTETVGKDFDDQYTELRKEIHFMRKTLGIQFSDLDEEQKKEKIAAAAAAVEFDFEEDNSSAALREKTLEVTCKSTTCIFADCGRRIDSQLMLIHYLSDHSAMCAATNCHELIEGDSVEIVFAPTRCHFRENVVLGLLVFGGTFEDKLSRARKPSPVFYNSFLTKEYEHLESHIPVMLMLCRTSNSATLKDRKLASRIAKHEESKDHIFVIWLFSPSNQRINAILKISGPNENIKRSTIIALRQMCHPQITEQFMPYEHNYWKLTHADVKHMSNNFTDKMLLNVSLIRCPPPTN